MYGPDEDDIVEHDGGPLRAPGWARRPGWLPVPGWRPSRGAAILGVAGLIVGLAAGYGFGHGRLVPGRPAVGGDGRSCRSFGHTCPSRAATVGPGRELRGLRPRPGHRRVRRDRQSDQTAGACSVQHGRGFQLGVEVINLSGTTVTLGQVRPVLPMRGLRAVSQQWAPCDAISPSWLIAGGDGTVTIIRAQSGAVAIPPGATRLGDALQGDDVVPPGGTAWFSVTFQVLVSCPGPLPVQFSVSYQASTRPGTAQLPGFPDLGKVPYTGCGRS